MVNFLFQSQDITSEMTLNEGKLYPMIFMTEDQLIVTYQTSTILITNDFTEALDIYIKFSELFQLNYESEGIRDAVQFLLKYCYCCKRQTNDLIPLIERLEKLSETLTNSQEKFNEIEENVLVNSDDEE